MLDVIFDCMFDMEWIFFGSESEGKWEAVDI